MTCPACDLPSPPEAEACPRCGLDLSNGIGRRTVVAGRYEVLGLLGRGSVATVYRALDRFEDVVVALKVFRPDVWRSPQSDASFRADLTQAQRIRHRNFCGILGCGEHAGLLFLAMECVSGTSLKQHLKGQAGLPLEEAFDLGIQIAAGLQAVHEAGLLHQDVKPQNVIVDEHGVARLMDMDVAKRWGSPAGITITAVGKLFGAPEYVSPELARGVPADLRSDVYSLGCVLYELFTGHPPYRAATPVATALKHVHEPIPLEGARAARIPEAMLPVLRKALAKNPARRYATARALASALGLARTMSGAPERISPPAPDQGALPALLGALNPVDATIRLDLADIKRPDPSARRAIPVLLEALEASRAQPEAPLADLLGEGELPEPVEVARGSGGEGAQGGPALSFVGSPGSIAILIEALKEKDGSVRSRAARALGGIGPAAKEAIPVLLDALQDREAHVRWDAARALGQIGAAAAEGLAAAVHDKDPVVRQIAADALKRIIQRKREIQSSD
jgi:tRNA A-37 threonylcarbamoyl transferase component Bud32